MTMNMGKAAAAKRLIDRQYDIIDEVELAEIRDAFAKPRGLMMEWDRLARKVRKTSPILRMGHIFWMYDVLANRATDHPVPSLTPPEKPYLFQRDPGVNYVRRWWLAVEKDDFSVGIEALREGAMKGYPAAMAGYGSALLAGEWVTRDEVAGLDYLERAVRASDGKMGAEVLAEALLERGDVERGISLLEGKVTTGGTNAALLLCEIYLEGKYSVAKDDARAVALALRFASRRRRLLAALGIPQISWARSWLADMHQSDVDFEALPHHEKQRKRRQLIAQLRGE